MKPRPNHARYLEILRGMTPEQRLRKAFELSEMGTELFRQGLKRRHPDLSPDELEILLRKHITLRQQRKSDRERKIFNAGRQPGGRP